MKNNRRRGGGRGRVFSTTSTTSSISVVRERSVDRLLPGFIHQFRTPLGAMRSLLETLLARKPASAGTPELELLMRSVKRLQDNVQALLLYSKGEVPPFTTGSLNDPVQALLDYLTPLCQDRKIQLERKLAAALPTVRFQSQLLQEALINFAMNGLDAMKPGGTLTLETTTAADGKAQIRIIDTGTGLKIRKTRAYRTTKKTGMGLGVDFAARILKAHSAEVAFESYPGRGTTVTVTFPIVPTDTVEGLA